MIKLSVNTQGIDKLETLLKNENFEEIKTKEIQLKDIINNIINKQNNFNDLTNINIEKMNNDSKLIYYIDNKYEIKLKTGFVPTNKIIEEINKIPHRTNISISLKYKVNC